MKIVGLDLSTSTGISFFDSGKLVNTSNIVRKVKGNQSSQDYPMNYLDMAEELSLKITAEIFPFNPDVLVIEETNRGKERYRQKQLEFIHFAFNKAINNLDKKPRIVYIDTSAWRKILGISLDSDQRKQNKARKEERDAKRNEISKNLYNQFKDQIKSETEGLKKREANKIIKQYDREITKLVGKEMKRFRSSIKPINQKTLSVEYVNETFDLGLKKTQDDIADAVCLAHAFIINNYSVKTN